MHLKRPIVACFLIACAICRADLQWTQSFETPGPTPGAVDQLERDEKGALYAVVTERGNQVWKWNASGEKLYEATLEGYKIVLGTHGDYFSFDSTGFSRYNRDTGARIWRQSLTNIEKLIVDQSGQPYVETETRVDLPTGWTYRNTLLKRSYVTGNPVWQRESGSIIMLSGPNFLVRVPTRLQLVSKLTGQVVNVIDQPVAGGRLQGVPLGQGGALLSFSNTSDMLYAYQPAGGLTKLEGTAAKFVPCDDGSVIVYGYGGSTRYRPNLSTIWRAASLPWNFTVDRETIYYAENGTIERHRLSDAQRIGSLPVLSPNNSVPPIREHNGHIVVGGQDSEQRARLITLDPASAALLSEWHSPSEGRPSNNVALAETLPNGNLITVATYGEDATTFCLSPTGDLLWMTTAKLGQLSYPRNFGGMWCDIAPDGSSVSITLQGDRVTRSIELDPETGAIRRQVKGFLLVRRDVEFRSTYHEDRTYTSKFDRSTGREIWRIPRSGPLILARNGDVYTGFAKNRGSDGQLIWTRRGSMIGIHNGRAFFQDYPNEFGAVDDRTGHPLWRTNFGQWTNVNATTGIDFTDDTVIFRPRGESEGQAFYVTDGKRAYFTGTYSNAASYGVATPSGYYRPTFERDDFQWTLTRSTGFFDLNQEHLADLPFEPSLLVSSPAGGIYIVGRTITGAFTVSRWR